MWKYRILTVIPVLCKRSVLNLVRRHYFTEYPIENLPVLEQVQAKTR